MNLARTTTLTIMASLILGPAFASWANPPSFQGIGYLPGDYGGYAYAISADGLVVGGDSRTTSETKQAVRWENGILTGLGDLPGGLVWSEILDLSANGSVLIGASRSDQGIEAIRYENGAMTGLGELPGGEFGSMGYGVSADGSVVIGYSISALGQEAFRWEDNVMTALGGLFSENFYSAARGVSADGSIVVGVSRSESGIEAFRWEGGVMTGLGDLPGGHFWSEAMAISADGSVIVGASFTEVNGEPFQWQDGVMTGLGYLPGANGGNGRANDVSADGSVIVGYSDSANSDNAPFIWDDANGMRSIPDVLTEDFGLDLTGWELVDARGVSADGYTIVGQGFNPDGENEGWIAHIPEIVCSTDGDCDDGEPCNGTERCHDSWECVLTVDADCNGNDVEDFCDIADGISEDCNSNSIPDQCDLADGTVQDCNGNSTPDQCDITSLVSPDSNGNDVPDECEVVPAVHAAPVHDEPKNRYVSFDPNNGDLSVAFSVELTEGPGTLGVLGWVGEPAEQGCPNLCTGDYVSAVVGNPVFRVWPEVVVHVGDCEIVPVATYEIAATVDEILFTDPLEVATIHKPLDLWYGDVVGFGTGALPPEPGFTGPNGVVNVTDVQALLLTIQGASSPSAHTTWVDLHGLGDGSPPNFILNMSDVQRILFAIQGQRYMDAPDHLNPADCP